MKHTYDRKTVFRVQLKLESTRLIEITILKVSGRLVASRAYRSHRKSSYRVGTAYIELLRIRNDL